MSQKLTPRLNALCTASVACCSDTSCSAVRCGAWQSERAGQTDSCMRNAKSTMPTDISKVPRCGCRMHMHMLSRGHGCCAAAHPKHAAQRRGSEAQHRHPQPCIPQGPLGHHQSRLHARMVNLQGTLRAATWATCWAVPRAVRVTTSLMGTARQRLSMCCAIKV